MSTEPHSDVPDYARGGPVVCVDGVCYGEHSLRLLLRELATEKETANAAVIALKHVTAQKTELLAQLAEIPHVLGHPADASWCEAVDAHHAETEAELKETRRRLTIVHEYLISVWKTNTLPFGMSSELIDSLNTPV